MATRIFITNISGYIGGQMLESLVAKHPDYLIAALVRTTSKAQQLSTRHPSLQLVIGDLDSTDLLIEQSKAADIVIQTADCDHPSSIKAIIQGLSDPARIDKGTFIQISGAASTIDISAGYGQPSSKIWDDIVDIHEITHFPPTIIHAITDQLVISEGLRCGVKTAILVPPMVYGKSDGMKKFSFGLPTMVEAVEKRGKMIMIGEAKHFVTAIHVKDLAAALVLLVEDAVAGNVKMDWGVNGVYYVEGGEYLFRDIVERISKEMLGRGIIKGVEIEELSAEQAAAIHPWGALMWGSNLRTRASRLNRLGWKAKELGVIDLVPELFMAKE